MLTWLGNYQVMIAAQHLGLIASCQSAEFLFFGCDCEGEAHSSVAHGSSSRGILRQGHLSKRNNW